MYTLYGSRGSGSAAVEAALALVGAPCRIVETASWDRNDAFQELLKLNPLGQIPTLVLPDGSALSESAAILIHLGSVHPDSGLLPRAPVRPNQTQRVRSRNQRQRHGNTRPSRSRTPTAGGRGSSTGGSCETGCLGP